MRAESDARDGDGRGPRRHPAVPSVGTTNKYSGPVRECLSADQAVHCMNQASSNWGIDHADTGCSSGQDNIRTAFIGRFGCT